MDDDIKKGYTALHLQGYNGENLVTTLAPFFLIVFLHSCRKRGQP